jgi:O-antigen ligase
VTTIIEILSPLYVLFIPAFLIAGLILLYRTLARNDRPAGLVLYIGTVMILDSYMQSGLFIPGFQQGSIKYSEIVWLMLFLQDRKRKINIDRALGKKIALFVSLYIILLFVAACRTGDLTQGIFYFRSNILPQFLAFYIAVRGLEKRDDYQRFFAYLTILLLFITIFHLWLVFADTLILESDTFYSESFQRNLAERRYGSIFGNPNALGVLVVLLLPVNLTFLLSGKKYRAIFFFNVLNLIFLLSQTRSRGPMLAMVPALGMLFVLRPKHYKKLVGYVLLGSIVFSLTMPGIVSQMTRRLRSQGISREFNQQEDSYIGRTFLWKSTLRIIRDHPLGIGLSDEKFVDMMMDWKYSKGVISDESSRHADNPHNSLLEIAVKAGVPALVIFLIILYLFFKEAIKSYVRNRDDIVLGIGISIFAYVIAINSEPIMFRPWVANLFWIVMGLGISRIAQEGNRRKRIDSAEREEIQEV